METLGPLKLVSNLRAAGKEIWDAGLGANPLPAPKELVRALVKYAHKKEYTPLTGIPGLTDALIPYIGGVWSNIVYGNGLKELLFVVQLAFEGTIVHITPSWVSYYKQLDIIGKRPIEIHTGYTNEWKVTAEQRHECFSAIDGPKMLLFNNPNNPTGVRYTPEEVAMVGQICRMYDVLVLADEIYGHLVFDDSFVSIGVHTTAIRASSISKDMGCGGYKLGWLAFPKQCDALRTKVIEIAATIYSCPTAPIQYAFRDFLKDEQNYGPTCLKTTWFFKELTEEVCRTLATTRLKFIPTQSSWYVFVGFEDYDIQVDNDKQLVERLIDEVGLICVPGSAFRCPHRMWVRLSLIDIENMQDGLERLVRWLSEKQ